MGATNIPGSFPILEDLRQSWKALFPLHEILLVVFSRVMAGTGYFVEIERWSKRKLAFF